MDGSISIETISFSQNCDIKTSSLRELFLHQSLFLKIAASLKKSNVCIDLLLPFSSPDRVPVYGTGQLFLPK